MQIVWFAAVSVPSPLDALQLCDTVDWDRIPGLVRAIAHTPVGADDPFLMRETAAALTLQVYVDALSALEEALRPDGALAPIGRVAGDGAITQQAMAVRPFDVADASAAHRASACSYLVAYQGPAQDYDAWLGHYLDTHARHLTRLPAVREVEVYTRLDWCSGMPWRRDTVMQRNKVVFDDAPALTAALASPVRARMREDFLRFPAFEGAVSHVAVESRRLSPR